MSQCTCKYIPTLLCRVHYGTELQKILRGKEYLAEHANVTNAKLEAECLAMRTELAALKQEIDVAPTVYGWVPTEKTNGVFGYYHHVDTDTHRARLIRIEEIK